jgi:hypothetical protein
VSRRLYSEIVGFELTGQLNRSRMRVQQIAFIGKPRDGEEFVRRASPAEVPKGKSRNRFRLPAGDSPLFELFNRCWAPLRRSEPYSKGEHRYSPKFSSLQRLVSEADSGSLAWLRRFAKRILQRRSIAEISDRIQNAYEPLEGSRKGVEIGSINGKSFSTARCPPGQHDSRSLPRACPLSFSSSALGNWC